jgi:hypothetical protein
MIPTARLATLALCLSLFSSLAQAQVAARLTLYPSTVAQGAIQQSILLEFQDAPHDIQIQPMCVDVDCDPSSLALSPVNWIGGSTYQFFVSVSPDAAPGPYTLGVSDTGIRGGQMLGSVSLEVVPGANSLVAPLSVRSVVLIHPVEGRSVGHDEALWPQARIEVQGSGVVSGVWLQDGMPFDSFVMPTRAGEPLTVDTHIAVPRTNDGPHELSLRIHTPQPFESSPVRYFQERDGSPGLQALSPSRNAVHALSAAPLSLRWSLEPGAVGYQLLFARHRGDPATVSRRVAFPPFTLHDGDLDGDGLWYWAVRPIYAMGVKGEPGAWSSFILLPDRIGLNDLHEEWEDQALVFDWASDTRGALYEWRLEDRHGTTLANSFQPTSRHRMPRVLFTGLQEGPDLQWRVRAWSPEGRMLGESPPQTLAMAMPPVVASSSTGDAGFGATQPADGSQVTEKRPEIRATWTSDTDPEDVALVLDGTDLTGVSQVDAHSIVYRPTRDLDDGTHHALLAVGSELLRWSFQVGESTAEAKPASQPSDVGAAKWSVDLGGQFHWISGGEPNEQDSLRLTAKGRWSYETVTDDINATADMSWRDPDMGGDQPLTIESRNYLGRGERAFANGTASGVVGFTSPQALSGSTFLDAGPSRGGVELGLEGPMGHVQGYASYDPSPSGIRGATPTEGLDVLALGYEIPQLRPDLKLRVLGLWTDHSPAAGMVPGKVKGQSVGVLGSLALRPGWQADFEWAHSERKTDNFGDRNGNAARLGLDGVMGATQLGLRLSHSDQDFSNSASGNLMAGSQSGRNSGELRASRRIAKGQLSAGARYVRAGDKEDLVHPRTQERAFDASYSTPLAPGHTLVLSANSVYDSADKNTAGLEEARSTRGVNATLSHTVGRFAFSETVSKQKVSDESTPSPSVDTDTDTWIAVLSASGSLHRQLRLGANFSETHNDIGGLNSTVQVLTLQPTWTAPRGGVSITPRVVRSSTDVDGFGKTVQTQWQLVLGWDVPEGRLDGLSLQTTIQRSELDVPGADSQNDDSLFLTAQWKFSRRRR